MTIEERLEVYGPSTCPVCGEYARVFVRNELLNELVCVFCDRNENAHEAGGWE